jgi:hypothetical protein
MPDSPGHDWLGCGQILAAPCRCITASSGPGQRKITQSKVNRVTNGAWNRSTISLSSTVPRCRVRQLFAN